MHNAILTLLLIVLAIMFRCILKCAKKYFEDSFFEERRARFHRVLSPFDSATVALPLGAIGVIAIFYFSPDRWVSFPSVAAGIFLGIALGYVGAYIKD